MGNWGGVAATYIDRSLTWRNNEYYVQTQACGGSLPYRPGLITDSPQAFGKIKIKIKKAYE